MSQPPAIPPPFRVLGVVSQFWQARALWAAVKAGIPDILSSGPKNAAQIAREAGANEESVYRLLRALASIGFFQENADQQFENNEISSLLGKNHPSGLYYTVLAEIGTIHYEAYLGIEDTLKTGKSNTWNGEHYWDHSAKNPEHAANFDKHMSAITSTMTPAILQIYDFSQFKSIVDVGGSQGVVVRKILDAHPSISEGITFDLARTIETNKTIARDLPAGRYHEVAGNFLESPSGIPEGKDAYLMKQILHDWSDAHSEVILKNVAKAMRKDSKLILVESIVQPSPGFDFTKWLDIHMMVLCGGKERTEAQWKALLATAGLVISKIAVSPPMTNVIEVVKA